MLKQYEKNTVIFSEGDEGSSFFDVISGEVGIFIDYGKETQKRLTIINSGHIFGELAFIDSLPRSGTAVALTDAVIDEVTAAKVMTHYVSDPEKIRFIICELGERLSRLTKEYQDACEILRQLKQKDRVLQSSVIKKIKEMIEFYKMVGKSQKIGAETYKTLVQTDYGYNHQGKGIFYRKGDVLFKEGEAATRMYAVSSGSVQIISGYGTPQEQILTEVRKKHFFGELGLLGNQRRSATAVVGEDQTEIDSIALDDFWEIYQEEPDVFDKIIHYLASRIRSLTDEYLKACGRVCQETENDQEISDEVRKA